MGTRKIPRIPSRFLSLILFSASFFVHPTAFARDIYFLANAVSNFTAEDQEDLVMGMGCTWNAGTFTYDCPLPALKCRVMVVNPVGGNDQNVVVSLDHYIMHQNADTGPNFVSPDPYRDGGSNDLDYTAVGNTGVNGWKGSTTATGALTQDSDGTVTLSAGQFYIYEKYISLSYSIVSDNSGNYPMLTYSKWPFAKWYSACSGKITVTDASATNPGLVIANGSLDYYVSSYQNAPMVYGGFNEIDTSANTLSFRQSTYALSSGTCMMNIAASPPPEGWIMTYGYSSCYAYAYAGCSATIDTYNGRKTTALGQGNASRTWPLQIGQVPVTVNGGSPF